MEKSVRPDAVSMPISVRSVELSQIGGAAATGKAPRESARTAAAQETLEAFIGSSSRLLRFGRVALDRPHPVLPAEPLHPGDALLGQAVGRHDRWGSTVAREISNRRAMLAKMPRVIRMARSRL